MLACAAAALGVHRLVRRGSAEQTTTQRAEWVHELVLLIQDGDFPRASRLVALLRADATDLRLDDPHLGHLLRAEAVLYRHYDADPARLRAIEAVLARSPEARSVSSTSAALARSPAGSPLDPSKLRSLRAGAAPPPGSHASASTATRIEPALVAMVLASRRERAEHVATLDTTCERLSEDPECFYALATALEQRGDVDAARAAWKRAWDLGPAWLSHRFDQASFEHHHGGDEAAARLVAQMKRMAPSAPWTELASTFGSWLSVSPDAVVPTAPTASANVEVGVAGVAPNSSAAASQALPAPSPVHEHRARLLEAVAAARRGDVATGRRLLANAMTAVHGERAFILDAFDWLLDERAYVLASELTAREEWPASLPMAKSMVSQLAEASAKPAADSLASGAAQGAGGTHANKEDGRGDSPSGRGTGKHRGPGRKPARGKGRQ